MAQGMVGEAYRGHHAGPLVEYLDFFFFSNYFRRPLKVFNLKKNGCLRGNGRWANLDYCSGPGGK